MESPDLVLCGLTVAELIEESHGTSVEKGWWQDTNTNFLEKLMLIVSEVSEVCEEYRVNGIDPDKMIYYSDGGKPEGIASELADVLIRVADLCGKHQIPLEEALIRKLEYNKTRPFRHGGKLA